MADAAGQTLLTVFKIDKVFYEVCYEARNRPDWLRIPVQGLLRLVSGLVPEADPSVVAKEDR